MLALIRAFACVISLHAITHYEIVSIARPTKASGTTVTGRGANQGSLGESGRIGCKWSNLSLKHFIFYLPVIIHSTGNFMIPKKVTRYTVAEKKFVTERKAKKTGHGKYE